jgi:tetratricopeptide (TPR) repeat protein
LLTLHELRDYPAMLKASEALLAIDSDNKWALSYKISAYQDSGELKIAAKLLPRQIDSDRLLLLSQTSQWLYERRYDEVIKALTGALLEVKKPNMWFERQEYLSQLALVYHVAGKTPEAQETARALKETLNTDQKGGDAIYDCARLAEVYAFLGDKAQAIATLQPLKTEKDVAVAADFPDVMAEIGALTSDKEMALTYLAVAPRTPSYSGPSYGDLKFGPLWDVLRGDPRFEKIVASLAPKK